MRKDKIKVGGISVEVEVCPYDEHPSIEIDSRVPGYHIQSGFEGCINCLFVKAEHGLNCRLTPNDRGYRSGVSPIGKCKRYKKHRLVEL